MTTSEPKCDLCGDQPEKLDLRARCHLTAPLAATLYDGVLTLSCYVPECGRPVARFRVSDPDEPEVDDDGRFEWLRDKLMLADESVSDALGLRKGWCGSLREAIDCAMEQENA